MSLALLLVHAPLVLARGAEAAPPQGAPELTAVVQDCRGKIVWFTGSYDELLAEAARSKRLVFLDFYSRSNTFSKKLEKNTYSSPAVVAALKDVLCFSVDTDAKETKPLLKRFQVQNAPAMVFLDPDGALRDQISGYRGPEWFLMDLARIKQNKGTFSDLRARIQRDAADLDARWELAKKLRAIGDLVGFEDQVSQIRERDREGRSTASRLMHVEGLCKKASATLDLDPLYEFVRAEKESALLYEGWLAIWNLEGQAARAARDPEKERMHELRHFAAARELWPRVPEEEHGRLGNNIAWSFYENRDGATRSDLEFALSVAFKAVEAAPDAPSVVDTLACCLFAVGKRDEALAQVKRCIELDPQNPQWRERLAGFQKVR